MCVFKERKYFSKSMNTKDLKLSQEIDEEEVKDDEQL